MMPPRGSEPIIDALQSNRLWGKPVIVSFTGDATNFSCTHIYPEPGKAYDWGFLWNLDVSMVVSPGLGVDDEILKIAAACRPYALLADVDRCMLAHVVGVPEGIEPRLWQVRKNSLAWLEWFGDDAEYEHALEHSKTDPLTDAPWLLAMEPCLGLPNFWDAA